MFVPAKVSVPGPICSRSPPPLKMMPYVTSPGLFIRRADPVETLTPDEVATLPLREPLPSCNAPCVTVVAPV